MPRTIKGKSSSEGGGGTTFDPLGVAAATVIISTAAEERKGWLKEWKSEGGVCYVGLVVVYTDEVMVFLYNWTDFIPVIVI